jgi:hypothetical protein
MPACATTGTRHGAAKPPPGTTGATAAAAEPSAIEVAPGIFIPGKEGYVVLLKSHGADLLNWMNVPRHKPSAENLDELKLSLFNAACYATPEGSWPWAGVCGHSMLACTGGALSGSCTEEPYVRCLAEVKQVSAQRVLLLNHWEPIQLPDSECMLPCACEGGAVTLDKREPGGYRASGTGCVNAFTCSFVCLGDPAPTNLAGPSRYADCPRPAHCSIGIAISVAPASTLPTPQL